MFPDVFWKTKTSGRLEAEKKNLKKTPNFYSTSKSTFSDHKYEFQPRNSESKHPLTGWGGWQGVGGSKISSILTLKTAFELVNSRPKKLKKPRPKHVQKTATRRQPKNSRKCLKNKTSRFFGKRTWQHCRYYENSN